MADSDQSLQIFIETIYKSTGVQLAEQDAAALKTRLGGLADQTKETEKASGLFEGRARAIHQILHLIGREAGPEAEAALAGVASVAAGEMLLGVLAAKAFFEWLEKIHKKAEEMAEQTAAVFIAQRDAIQAANDAATEFNEQLEKSKAKVDDLKTVYGGFNAELAAEIEGHKKILDALEKEQLAQAKGDKQKEEAIKSRFEDIKREYDLAAEQKKLDQDRQQLAGLKQQNEKLSAIAADQEAEAKRISSDEEASAADARLKGKDETKLRVAAAAAEERIHFEASGPTVEAAQAEARAMEQEDADIQALKAFEADTETVRKHTQAKDKATKKAEDAAKALEENNNAIREQTDKVNTGQSVFGAHQNAAATEAMLQHLGNFASTGNWDELLQSVFTTTQAMATVHRELANHLVTQAQLLHFIVSVLQKHGVLTEDLKKRIEDIGK